MINSIDFDVQALQQFMQGRIATNKTITYYVKSWIAAMFENPERIEIKEIRIVER